MTHSFVRHPGRTGTVVAFDAGVGLGEVRDDDGSTYAFHCVGIADGSRHVDVGARVTFTTLPKLGRIEATDLRVEAGAP